MKNLELLSTEELRKACPLKWHENIPVDGISLGIADIDFKGPQGIIKFINSNLNDSFSFYAPYQGLLSAINASQSFLEQLGIHGIDSQTIQVIPGTMMGIFAVMEYFSQLKGNLTIINPIYPPIHQHAKQTGNKIDWIDLEAGWRLNPEKLMENISSSTKLLVLNNPNNPTGTVFTSDELRLIRDLAVDYDFTCFIDELYEPLVFNKKHISLSSLDGMNGRCITLFGFSKAYGLAGFRSGFLLIDLSEFKDIKYIIEQLIVSPSPITSLVMKYALTSPEMTTWKSKFKNLMEINTKKAAKFFNQNGITCETPNGGFFVFPDLKLEDDIKYSIMLLKKYGVQVIAGTEFGPAGKGHIRINCATSTKRLFEGLERIKSSLLH